MDKFKSRFPFYEDDADYTTNAPSYYADLARKQKLIKVLAERIWEYEETLDLTLEQITTRLESYIEENDNLMTDRLEQWDLNLEKFPENVELLLQEWLSDGTLDHIINETIFNWKADKEYVDELNENITTQLAQTVENINSMRINVKHLPAPYVSAVGDGVTDDTLAFQNAMDLAEESYGGNVSASHGFMGWYMPIIEVPHGAYKVGKVTSPRRFRLEGEGMSVLISRDGSPDEFRGTFIGNNVSNMTIKKIGFLFFDTVFKTATNNTDFSFITFEECNVAKLNTLIDMGDYASSRSTSFKMERCNVSYGVKTLVKLFCDKSHFANNWFNHSMDSYFMELDTFATFESNVWVPTYPGPNKAYIYFTGSDRLRSLHFKEERFGGEAGQCSIVVVGDVNKVNSQEQYRNQGISFDNCYLASHSKYNPNDIVESIRACIILRPTLSPLNTINYISFKNTAFSPDLNQGVVATYNTDDIKSLLPNDFVIDFDYSSTISGTKGYNKLASDNLLQFVNTPKIVKKSYHQKSGKLKVEDTQSEGIKKATFKIDRTHPTNYHTPFVYIVTTIGQGDINSSTGISYAYTSTYILTIFGVNTTNTHTKISFTKLHGDVGGVAQGANADIVSAHFGNGDTGSNNERLSAQTERYLDVTITFGERIDKGNIYVQPLFDFSLLS